MFVINVLLTGPPPRRLRVQVRHLAAAPQAVRCCRGHEEEVAWIYIYIYIHTHIYIYTYDLYIYNVCICVYIYMYILSFRFEGNSAVTRVVGFGHIGDGNLHLNITGPKYDEEVDCYYYYYHHYYHTIITTINKAIIIITEVAKSLEPWLWEWTQGVKGSISAEHGIGFKKRDAAGLECVYIYIYID